MAHKIIWKIGTPPGATELAPYGSICYNIVTSTTPDELHIYYQSTVDWENETNVWVELTITAP